MLKTKQFEYNQQIKAETRKKKFDDYKHYPSMEYYEKEKKKLVRKPTPEELEEILRIEEELWNS